jgi:hypothetical protein
MATYYLEPKSSSTGDPSWEASSIKEGCWVQADSENHARQLAENATGRMVSVKPGQAMKIRSPWAQPSLTDCKTDKAPRDIPPGKVLTKSGKVLPP